MVEFQALAGRGFRGRFRTANSLVLGRSGRGELLLFGKNLSDPLIPASTRSTFSFVKERRTQTLAVSELFHLSQVYSKRLLCAPRTRKGPCPRWALSLTEATQDGQRSGWQTKYRTPRLNVNLR